MSAVAARTAFQTAGNLMTCHPLAMMPDERLDIAQAVMTWCRLRHLPVTHAGELLGMISARDLIDIPLLREVTARAVMNSPVETVESSAPIATAVERMLARRFSSLPVVEGSTLVGMLTTTDLLRLACARLGDERVLRLMTPGPLTCIRPDQTIAAAARLMKSEHLRHLPVVDGDHLVGFLSDLDVLAAESHQSVGEATPPRLHGVSPESRAAEAGQQLLRGRLDALPVIRAGRLVGVLSAFDYLYCLLS